MKISKKEKMLLGVLGTVLVSVIYYQFVYVNQVEKLEIKRAELSEVEIDIQLQCKLLQI